MGKKMRAVVELLVDTDCEGTAEEWIGTMLSENGRDNGILDWGYASIGGQCLYPRPVLIDQEDYEEGDFLR